MSHTTLLPDIKPGSSGVTARKTESLVVDDEGRPLGVDEVGELWVRGPQVMAGYVNNSEATADTIDAEGWLHTGDLARIDADGHLFIVERVKELIKYNGFKVAPAELEALVLEHPDVSDAAVIGVPDIQVGEIPTAFVVVREGHEVGSQDIIEYVAGKVANYKRVRRVEFVTKIPKSAAGKILRRELHAAAPGSATGLPHKSMQTVDDRPHPDARRGTHPILENQMTTPPVLVEYDGPLAIATMQFAPYNLLSRELMDGVLDALRQAHDAGSRAVLLRSGLKQFCAGLTSRRSMMRSRQAQWRHRPSNSSTGSRPARYRSLQP